MTEQQRGIQHLDQEAVGRSLKTSGTPTRDVVHGDGKVLGVGDGKAQLEVFPDAAVARVTTASARVVLYRVQDWRVKDDRVWFEQESAETQTVLGLRADGAVIFRQTPRAPEAPETPATAGPDNRVQENPVPDAIAPSAAPETSPRQRRRKPPRGAQGPVADSPSAVTGAALEPLRVRRTTASSEEEQPVVEPTADADDATGDQDRSKERAPRLELTGRLGHDPRFRETAGGKLVGKFALAVHDQDGEATWHNIVVYGDLAKHLQERLAAGEKLKGTEVQVMGYQHTREKPSKDGDDSGKPKVEQYINAVAVVNRSS